MNSFLRYIQKLNEMARQDRMPKAATPIDSSFISFITHIPVQFQRLAGGLFWDKWLIEASYRRDQMAKEKGVRPDQIKEGFGPEYVEFFNPRGTGQGTVTRVYLKDPKTGENLVRHWAAPNRKIDPYARFFKVVEKFVGERGIIGTIPDDPTTNVSGHDLSGAYLDTEKDAKYNNISSQYIRKGGKIAHSPKETEFRLKHVDTPQIDYVAHKDDAIKRMSTDYIIGKLQQEVIEKLKFVNFDFSKLTVVDGQGKLYVPELKQFGNVKKTYMGIPVNLKHVIESPIHLEPVDWEKMQKEGWQPRHRPGYAEQENSFEAVLKTGDKYKILSLYGEPEKKICYKMSSPIEVLDLGINDGKFDYKVLHPVQENKIKQRGVEYSPLRIASSLEMISQDYDGDKLPSLEKPEGESGSNYGFKNYGGFRLNSDDKSQKKFEEPYQTALINLFKQRPELFGDDLDGYGDAPIRSIYTGFKRQDKKGASKLSYIDVFNYVTNNIRSPGFWMGERFNEEDENEMADYVKQLAMFSVGKSPEPKMNQKVENLLKKGVKWREGKAASQIYHDIKGNNQTKTIQAQGDEGDAIDVIAQSATSDFEGNRSDKLGRNQDEDGNDSSAFGRQQITRKSKIGLDQTRNPEEFAKQEIQYDSSKITNTIRDGVRNKIQKINNVILLKLNDMDEQAKSIEPEIKQSISQINSLLISKENQFIPLLQNIFGQTFDLDKLDSVTLVDKMTEIKMAIRSELNNFIMNTKDKKSLNHKYMISLYRSGTDIEFNMLINMLDAMAGPDSSLYNNVPEFRQAKDQLRKHLAQQNVPQEPQKPSAMQQIMARRKAERQSQNVPLYPNQNVPLNKDDEFKKAESFDFMKWFKKRDGK